MNKEQEERFIKWLSERDDDFELDIWDFRCLQDFINQELSSQQNQIAEFLEGKKEIILQGGDLLPHEVQNRPIMPHEEYWKGKVNTLTESALAIKNGEY